MGFESWQRHCTALWKEASAKLCGIEQRAPPIFGSVAIKFTATFYFISVILVKQYLVQTDDGCFKCSEVIISVSTELAIYQQMSVLPIAFSLSKQ